MLDSNADGVIDTTDWNEQMRRFIKYSTFYPFSPYQSDQRKNPINGEDY